MGISIHTQIRNNLVAIISLTIDAYRVAIPATLRKLR